MLQFIGAQNLWASVGIGVAALVVLILSSNLAVEKVVSLAEYFGLSTTFMGMTVLSLATSIPEITSHLTASAQILGGRLDYRIGSAIVLGANIGSDVVQQTLIMGLVVFMTGTLYFRRYFLWKSMVPMIVTTVMCIVLGWDRTYSRWDGAILFGTFIVYTYFLYWDERKYYKKEAQPEHEPDRQPLTKLVALRDILIALAAMAVTVFSAQIVLRVTEVVVETTGIGGSFIGVVTLGVASALPEFVTALSGVRNRAHGISLGTLVGSNITNPLVAIGGGALLSTYWAPGPLLYWDLPWETVTGAILWVLLWFSRGRLGRRSAYYLMGLYVLYIVLRAVYFRTD